MSANYGSRGELMLAELGIRLVRNQNDNRRESWRILSSHTSLSENPQEKDESTGPTLEIAQIDEGEVLQNLNSLPDKAVFTNALIENRQADKRTVTENSSSSSSSSSSGSYSEIDDSDADPDFCDSQSSSIFEDKTKQPEENQKTKSRKRKAAPGQWKRNRAKILRNSGKPYKSVKKNVEVSGRNVRPPCNSKCRLKCFNKFLEEERITIFQNYWALGVIDKQRAFIAQSLQKIQPPYRYPSQVDKTRNYNNAFFFEKNGEKIRVCKMFFAATLDISNRCIRTVISKTKDGFLTSDLRGKHENHVQVSSELKDGIRAHIATIPVIESHYTRQHSSKKYIEGGKTVAQLYRDYQKLCEEEGKPVGNLTMYTRIFNYEFNYEFFSPKKDQCQQCACYINLSLDDKKAAETEYRSHLEEKELSRKEKEADKNSVSDKFQLSCFDLQAALPTPRGEISSFYYKSKLSTYNFTICDLEKKGLGDVYCYLWHEGEGNKGSTEIGSCLLKFLEEKSARSNTDELEITFYSDNCCGQQKNKFIIACYLYAVAKFRIKSITHKFLVVGHTQNEGDCVHSIIEKNIKRSLKSGPIYIPSQYATLIRTARKKGSPFKLCEMGYDDFKDIKDLTCETSSNFTTNTNNETLHFSDICIIKVEKQSLDSFFYKTSYKQTDFKMVNIKSSRCRKSLQSFKQVTLKKAYSKPIPISKKKFDGLQSLIASNAIPRCHSNFYNSLRFQ